MTAAKGNSSKEYRNCVQDFIVIDYSARKLCSNVLFKKEMWPTDGVELYRRQESEQSRICQLNNEYQILCLSGGFIDHHDFDVTFFTRVIEIIFGSKYQSLLKDLRNSRNQECHKSNKELPNTELEAFWKCTADILQNHGFNLSLGDEFKDYDLFLDQRVQGIVICVQGRWISAACDIYATVLNNTFCWSEILTNA